MQGRVFAWIDRMLSAPHMAARPGDWGPPKGTVARSALTNMLQSNSELASVFVDRSYAANQQVAAGYFQVRLFAAAVQLFQQYLSAAPAQQSRQYISGSTPLQHLPAVSVQEYHRLLTTASHPAIRHNACTQHNVCPLLPGCPLCRC